ncbi:hypothetical protein G7Y89_g11951 [Cudoniella acicularis]|uniref:Uncharacterized protein n=1 Tax=Cudoniella acicularis TaxID=354080 RepID=A0A8H4R9Y0_9HELO|nr:hypothetical protein G7Y89_g11951 [Cudoniella acicularis]
MVGPDLKARDSSGRTVLHIACIVRSPISTFQLLVEFGANPHERDYAGNTLFHEMAKQCPSDGDKEYTKLLDLILKFGVLPLSTNNDSQTPLFESMFCVRYKAKVVIPYNYFLGPKCNLDINSSDARGFRPIYLAAKNSADMVERLIRDGADPPVCSYPGQTVLHAACEERQSNIVGILVDLFLSRAWNNFIDYIDETGLTALHLAAKSGRSESVKILLQAGANPNKKTTEGLTPLTMCEQFKKLLTSISAWILTEDQTLGVRQIVKDLVTYGADVSFMTSSTLRSVHRKSKSIFEIAITSDCGVLADELLNVPGARQLAEDQTAEQLPALNNVNIMRKRRKMTLTVIKTGVECLIQEAGTTNGNIIEIFQALLLTENQHGINKFQSLGAEISIKYGCVKDSCLWIMAKWGYASYLEQVGGALFSANPTWIQDMRHKFDEGVNPLLYVARERTIPNLEAIKVLVEMFKVGINYQTKNGATVLHILAKCRYWWHTPALEYLFQCRANTELKTEFGYTSLHTTLYYLEPRICKRRSIAVKVLLRHGANPNVLDNKGISCLNKSGSNFDIIQQSIKSGADVPARKRPYIFDVIQNQGSVTVDLLSKLGTNFNAPLEVENPVTIKSDESDNENYLSRRSNARDLVTFSYPVHFAASNEFNNQESRLQMLLIIKTLLKIDELQFFLDHARALTLATTKNTQGLTPLHHALRSKQLWAIDPLLTHGADPLESDPEGNTTLHALSSHFYNWDRGFIHKGLDDLLLLLFHQFLALGIDVNTPNSFGKTPIFFFLRKSDSQIQAGFPVFMNAAAYLSGRNKEGQGLLHVIVGKVYGELEVSAYTAAVEVLKMLVEGGLDP